MTGRYAVALPYDTEPALGRTSQPWTRGEWVTSQTRRDSPTGLAHQGLHLAQPCPGLLQGLMQGVEFALPPDKAGEPASHWPASALADGTGADQLEHLHRR